MKKITKQWIYFCIIILFIFGIIYLINSFKESSAINSEITINNPNSTSQELKVLVIEINPVLNTVANKPKVSEYFKQNKEASLNEMIRDLEETSHNYLKIKTSYEYLNEFPTYRDKIELSNGTKANKLDEATFLKYSTDGWYSYITSNYIKDIFSSHEYRFDYDYIINKFDLINRRKKKEFDQVWLLSIDPTLTYETIMIGNNPFWINAPGYILPCENFPIVNVSISRRDANLHALGHGVEGIMNAAFNRGYYEYPSYNSNTKYKYYITKYNSYNSNTINVKSVSDYNNLNLWEKFILGDYSNTSNYGSVGNIHFTFNGEKDYDYDNTKNVYTNWKEWLDYPNINGNFILDNSNAWKNNEINTKLGEGENKHSDRLYTRFWFYLMPHISGYTKDGYLNNWWKYFYSLDFVTSIKNNGKSNINVDSYEYVKIDCDLIYNSLNKNKLTMIPEGNNIIIENSNILGFKNGYLYGKNVGSSKVTLYFDGKSITYNINVLKNNKLKTFKAIFNVNTASSLSYYEASCQTTNDSCKIKTPIITSKENETPLGFSLNSNSKEISYNQNTEYEIKDDITLYAVTKTIEIKNNDIGLLVKNIDTLTNQCIDKVSMQIKDNNSKVVDSFVASCDNYHSLNLKDGTYNLGIKDEIDGYATPNIVKIDVKNNTVINEIIINLTPINICINGNNTNSKFNLIKDDKIIESFSINNDSKCFSYISPGIYTVEDQNEINNTLIEVIDINTIQNFDITKKEVIDNETDNKDNNSKNDIDNKNNNSKTDTESKINKRISVLDIIIIIVSILIAILIIVKVVIITKRKKINDYYNYYN